MLEGELALPEEEHVDFVSVVTPNHVHFPVAHAFAEAGFNVVLDKPMVHDSEHAQKLIDVVEKTGIVFAVTYQYTGYPMVKQARFKPARAPTDVLKRGNEYLSEDAKRATRLPPCHPEAFANVYESVAATIHAEQEGAEANRLRQDCPNVYDGARGVHFIEKTVRVVVAARNGRTPRGEPREGGMNPCKPHP
jgi:hypothetical protein